MCYPGEFVLSTCAIVIYLKQLVNGFSEAIDQILVHLYLLLINSLLAIYKCPLLITLANSFRHNVQPDLDPRCLTLWWYSWKLFWKSKTFSKKVCGRKKHAQNSPARKELWVIMQSDQAVQLLERANFECHRLSLFSESNINSNFAMNHRATYISV